MTTKRYRLLKNLPKINSGNIFYFSNKLGAYIPHYTNTGEQVMFSPNMIENNPEWFEEVKEDAAGFVWTDELVSEYETWCRSDARANLLQDRMKVFKERWMNPAGMAQIKETDWDVVQYKTSYLGFDDVIFTKIGNDIYSPSHPQFSRKTIATSSLSKLKESKNLQIYAVLRKSDGWVIMVNNYTAQGQVKKIEHDKGTGLLIYVDTKKLPYNYPFNINEISKPL